MSTSPSSSAQSAVVSRTRSLSASALGEELEMKSLGGRLSQPLKNTAEPVSHFFQAHAQPLQVQFSAAASSASGSASAAASSVKVSPSIQEEKEIPCSLSNKDIKKEDIISFKKLFKKEIEQLPLSVAQADVVKNCFVRLAKLVKSNCSYPSFITSVQAIAQQLYAHLCSIEMNATGPLSQAAEELSERNLAEISNYVCDTITYFFIANIFKSHYKIDNYNDISFHLYTATLRETNAHLQKKANPQNSPLRYSDELKALFESKFKNFRFLINNIVHQTQNVSLGKMYGVLKNPSVYANSVEQLFEIKRIAKEVGKCGFTNEQRKLIRGYILAVINPFLLTDTSLINLTNQFYSALHFLYKYNQVNLDGPEGKQNLQALSSFVKNVAYFSLLFRHYFSNMGYDFESKISYNSQALTAQQVSAFSMAESFKSSPLQMHDKIEGLSFDISKLISIDLGITKYNLLSHTGPYLRGVDSFNLLQFKHSSSNLWDRATRNSFDHTFSYGWQQKADGIWMGVFVTGTTNIVFFGDLAKKVFFADLIEENKRKISSIE